MDRSVTGRLLPLAFALLAAGCYDSPAEPQSAAVSVAADMTLTELHRLYRGAPVTVARPIVITGVVTTSDRDDNFYRTLCIQEGDAAAELMAGIDYLHRIYPVGCRLTIDLEGLTIGCRYGVLQIGRAADAYSSYPTDYIGSREALDRSVVRGAVEGVSPLRLVLPLGDTTLCGCLVRIDGVRYLPDGVEELCWQGTKRFVDRRGNEIRTYTGSYARFARNDVPMGEVSLTGILQYDAASDAYRLKLRSEDDCIPCSD